jgi:hypothetical protein
MSWQSERGRSLARQIATRELPFSAFIHAQLRLWVYEGLRMLTRGPGGQLGEQEDRVLWRIAEDFQLELHSRRLTEFQLVDLVKLDELATPEINGDGDLTKWRNFAPTLPAQLRGPLAYVLGRVCDPQNPLVGSKLLPLSGRKNLEDRKQSYFEFARQHAASAPDPTALRKLLESDSPPSDADSPEAAP